MKVETDILGDMAAVKMATAGMADVVADVAVAIIVTTTTPAKPNLIHPDFILRLSGTNFPLKSMTRFRRSVIRKVNPVEQSKSLAASPLNKSPPSSVPCIKHNQ